MTFKAAVLSIDGGGIKGIVPAMVLTEIEERTQKSICELFNFIAGTSTGGILALELTKPSKDDKSKPEFSAEQLVNLYETKGELIFQRRKKKTMSVNILKKILSVLKLVGVQDHETVWNVMSGGPADDALKFAHWLHRRGVPKDNIRLCLSPINENFHLVEQSEIPVESANQQNIYDIITNFLSEKAGDLLFIYWSGHGFITSERERRLICADSTNRDWNNLDINSLLSLLASDRFAILNHICIFETSANYLLEDRGRPTNLAVRKFSFGIPRINSRQFVLFATREGEQSRINAEGKTGYFSQAFREASEEDSLELWPPRMEVVAEEVKQRFKSLDRKQISTFYCRNWDGDIEVYDI